MTLMTKQRTALFSGSFDPVTNGHMAILASALDLFDHVVAAIGVHHGKQGLFTFEERKALLQDALVAQGSSADRVSVIAFDGLVVDAARQHGASAIIRGLRDSADFAYEMQMAGMNAAMAPDVHTMFVPASTDTRPISATLVRQIAKMGGDVSAFVPANVAAALTRKLNA